MNRHPVVTECLSNAQALRFQLHQTREEIAHVDSAVAIRLYKLERMVTYLLAAMDYFTRDDAERSLLFDTLDERSVEGIGPDPLDSWDDD